MRKYLLIIFISFLISNIAKSNECIEGDCINGRGIKSYLDGASYIGEYKNGKRNGFGSFIFLENTRYIGMWKNNMPNGLGINTFNDGTVSYGMFLDGQENGLVHTIYSNGGKFFGEKINSTKHGFGMDIFTESDSKFYLGEFVNGEMTGIGVHLLSNGNIYKGIWSKGKLEKEISVQGEGCVQGNCQDGKGYFIINKNEYIGNFKNGAPNGIGIFILNYDQFKEFGNGEIYIGNFIEGEMSGKGYFFYSNGDIYNGQFEDDYPNGEGTLIYANGKVSIGNFKNGKLTKLKHVSKSVSDVILDGSMLKGKLVNVEGYFSRIGNISYLYQNPNSPMNSLSVELKSTDRDTKKYLIKKCEKICKVKLLGVLIDEFGQSRLDIINITK